ncbi:lipid IV(A) 3-deoxy-D-manno-octulosonic acid transferase [Helicobacter canadensis]|uniref:3-deoxy-D-manno-octulosonic acid transferase n=1 Tax=Helicobacter canadensis MIT 98-5491 TaxID=537970 RepID=C5ZY00_9HELI|nr:lipid IV(A) 3-deoxy-D-manno-octulosonic acid transferase [Helicobacter canadensis]EES90018.1 3-deoxy-D-manno-octulosonic-acid transferase [Helicobacter canadensis MIT 98-5491]EFR49168.1 3-deoxy-D-manno-octulosonic-acid transferase [Helicobacter canadensis MIT 98-5491]STP02482.1 3-deoxy-D-manno-octulosonic-acid transferase [Helicobacter canadensis]
MGLFVSFYYLLLCIAHICALPFLFFLSFKSKYTTSIKRRFFLPHFINSKMQIHWFHACSYGEVKSLQGIITSLSYLLKPNEQILLTTTTQTGYTLAKQLFPNAITCFLPFETFIPFWTKNLKIKSLTLIEAELWLMPLFCAKNKKASTLLINARISSNSYNKYRKLTFFYRRLFTLVDNIFCQEKKDKQYLKTLGAKNIKVFGNLKLAEIPQITKHYQKPSQELWLIASTHEKNSQQEEVLILKEILKILPKNSPNNPRILFAPRHPERFKSLIKTLNALLKQNHCPNLSVASQNGIQVSINAPFGFIDTLGELNNLYSIASLVILGGSFLPNIGGHNPIEPAFFRTKLISGPYIYNQKSLFKSLQNYSLTNLENLHKILAKSDLLPPSKITKKLDITKIINIIRNEK